jgi:proline iminopeptidase
VGFKLDPLAGDRTRLVVSGYWALRPKWLQPIVSLLVLEPAHWIMQSRQFTNLERRSERAATYGRVANGVHHGNEHR